MNQFYKLNKSKILKSLKFLSLTGIAFVSVILLIAFFNNQLPSEILLGKIFITAGIIFPFFGLTIAYLDWESRNLLKNKKFNKNPLNQLQKIGFKDSYLNQDNKWHFTEKIKKSVIKDYTIEANIEREKSKFIKFSHKIDFSIYNSSMLIKAIDNLEKNGIYLENKRIIKRIRINNIKTVGYLENELIRFVDELKKNKIAPDKNGRQHRISSIVALCTADTNAHALKSFLFTILVSKFPQLKDIQDRCQKCTITAW